MSFHQSGRAKRVLEELQKVIEDGYERRALQRSPHLVLLNSEWYHENMRPVMSRWMTLWLEANHVSGMRSEWTAAYLAGDGAGLVGTEWDDAVEAQAAVQEAALDGAAGDAAARALRRLHVQMTSTLTTKAFKLLNLSAEWLRTYLPHCLAKIDRVSFGLLSMAECMPPCGSNPQTSRASLVMCCSLVRAPYRDRRSPRQVGAAHAALSLQARHPLRWQGRAVARLRVCAPRRDHRAHRARVPVRETRSSPATSCPARPLPPPFLRSRCDLAGTRGCASRTSSRT